jgi:hypothetical protein
VGSSPAGPRGRGFCVVPLAGCVAVSQVSRVSDPERRKRIRSVTRSDRRSVFVAALYEARAMLRTGALARPDPLAALSREVACVLVSPYNINAPDPLVSPKGGFAALSSGSYFGSSDVRGDEHLDARHVVRGECVCLVPRVGSWPAPRGQRALCRSSPAHGASGGIVLHQPTGHRVVAS